MKIQKLYLAGSLALAAAAIAAASPVSLQPLRQSGDTQSDGAQGVPLRPLLSSGEAGQESADDAFDLEGTLRERLAQLDLDRREEAFDEAVAMAALDPKAGEALQAICEDSSEPELAFVARLALREAERERKAASRDALPPPLGSRPGSADPFDAMRQRMDSMFKSDPFLNDFFAEDPFQGRRFPGSMGGRFGRGPLGAGQGADPFEALRQRAERLRRELDSGGAAPGTPQRLRRAAPLTSSVSSSMSIERSPSGVRVEITEDVGNGPETKVYEAPTMEALLEAAPELKGRVR